VSITTMSQLVAAFPGQYLPFTKAAITGVAGAFTSLWTAAGLPGAGAASVGNNTTGLIPTSTTAGAFTFTNPAGGGVLSYLGRIRAASSSVGTLLLADRVWHGGAYTSVNGSISATTTTAVDRDSTGAAVELWAEIATALSATATTITVTYINQAGTTGRTATVVLPASAIAARMFPFALQAGDTGVRQITAISGSAAPTGTFNLVMLRRVADVPLAVAGVSGGSDFAALGMPQVFDNACVFMLMNTNSTSTGTLSGSAALVQG